MASLYAVRRIPLPLQTTISGAFSALAGTSYAWGGTPWRPWDERTELRMLCSDVPRAQVAYRWAEANHDLRIGGVTWRWLHEAVKSCRIADDPGFLSRITIPVHIMLASRENLIDNKAAQIFADRLPQGSWSMLDGAKHEIIMERDEWRNQFLAALDTMLDRQ